MVTSEGTKKSDTVHMEQWDPGIGGNKWRPILTMSHISSFFQEKKFSSYTKFTLIRWKPSNILKCLNNYMKFMLIHVTCTK